MDPGQIHLLKFHVNIKRSKYIKYFLKEDYNSCKNNNNNFSNKNENIDDDYYQSDLKPKLNFLKRVIIITYVFIYNFSFIFLVSL